MEVYLLRHGIASDDSPTGKDADRALTDEGRRKLRDVMKTVSAAGIRPDVVVSSPYVRARQTAEIAHDLLGVQEVLHFAESLTPDGDPEDVWRELRNGYAGFRSVMLVSHEPLMGRCTGYLLGAPELLLDFKKGAVVLVELEPVGMQPRGVLRWMLIPKLARA